MKTTEEFDHAEATRVLHKPEKKTRMRHVFDTPMVAHLWANQSQNDARNQQSNFFFHGKTIYSYGRHFPIATHITIGKRKCILFTSASYGPTTGRHIQLTRRAITGTVFTVPNVIKRRVDNKTGYHIDHKENLAHYQTKITETAKKAMKARQNKIYLLCLEQGFVTEGNDYITFFKLKRKPFTMPTDIDIKAEEDKAKRYEEKRQAREEERNRQKKLDALADVDLWKAGQQNHISNAWLLDDVYLRVRDEPLDDRGLPLETGEDRVLQTTMGAEVLLAHALRLLPLIRSGKAYKHNGHSEHVGHFKVDEINEAGDIKIGCHLVKRAEIERIASQLGLENSNADTASDANGQEPEHAVLEPAQRISSESNQA